MTSVVCWFRSYCPESVHVHGVSYLALDATGLWVLMTPPSDTKLSHTACYQVAYGLHLLYWPPDGGSVNCLLWACCTCTCRSCIMAVCCYHALATCCIHIRVHVVVAARVGLLSMPVVYQPCGIGGMNASNNQAFVFHCVAVCCCHALPHGLCMMSVLTIHHK